MTSSAAVLSQSYLAKSSSPQNDHNNALAVLSLAADLTTLEMNVSELGNLLFELQELRHSSTASNDENASEAKPIDQALSVLADKLESVTRESEGLRSRLGELSAGEGAALASKHGRIASQITAAQAEADVFHEELKEDKWLVVFRTVSSQAEGMMDSLDKILTACHDFVWDIGRSDSSSKPGRQRHGSSSTASSTSGTFRSNGALQDPESVQAILGTYISLHRSLHAKTKYYAPSCCRVLEILGKGIQERSTKNGEVLRKYADLKNRHRNLQDRMIRVQREMDAAEDLLKQSGAPSEGSPNSTYTPPTDGSATSKVQAYTNLGKNSGSPFRRLTNRLSSFNGTPPVPPVPNDYEPAREQTTIKPRESKPSHRSTPSANFFNPPPNGTRSVSSPISHAASDRPKWNTSLRIQQPEAVRDTPRKSAGPSSLSAYSYSTPPSRSLSPSLADSPLLRPTIDLNRPISPSGLSSVSALSLGAPSSAAEAKQTSSRAKPRPSSPQSRIPAPSPKVRRFRSSTPFGMQDDSDNDSEAPTSMMQRANSPTPSNAYLSSSLPVSNQAMAARARQRKSSYNPQNDQEILVSSSSNIRKTPQARTQSRQSMGNRSSILTPEPAIRAQAARINKMARPSLPSQLNSKKSYTTLSSASKRPRASVIASPGPGRDGMLSPTIMLDNQALPTAAYVPNPVDILDLEIADIVNAQPLYLFVERVDLPLNKYAAQQQKVEDRTARYIFGGQAKPVQCKLITRKKGNETVSKVMCKSGGIWNDLELMLLDLQATMY